MRPAGSTGPRQRPPGRSRRQPGPLARGVARLVVRAADASTRLVTALLGASPTAGRERISERELRDLVAANTVLDPVERRIIDEVLVSGTRMVREVMVPRTEVVFLSARLTLAEAARLVRAEIHSRYPVVDGTHDDVIGFVHLRDVLLHPADDPRDTVGGLSRDVKKVPGTKRVLATLMEMRREGHHLAVVVDEYGGTAGIVTLEDLIEELVGEIHDGYDVVPDPPPGRPTEVDGRLNLADFAERIGFALPPGPYETVGGFVMAALGRLPRTGDEVPVPGAWSRALPASPRPDGGPDGGLPEGGWLLRVLTVEGRRVARVGVVPVAGPDQPVSVPAARTDEDAMPERSGDEPAREGPIS